MESRIENRKNSIDRPMTLLNTIKEPIAGFSTSALFSAISWAEINEVLQFVSALLAIIVAVLTIRLTILRIKNEKRK